MQEHKGVRRVNMSERKMKRVEDSLTEQSHLLNAQMPECCRLSYSEASLLAWIDETAGIVAKRHAEMNVVTVAVDNMYFKAGAKVNDTDRSDRPPYSRRDDPLWKSALILTAKLSMEPEP